ncbi:MAG: Branched-chain-amino-acid aminotransferase [bacterium ADurb.Bin478]|nr:MAG: Branched-chain-amino-acid aminotransferase [bacterium ADurb.Bin478]
MDPKDEKGKLWMNGQLIPWMDAKIHVLSHVVSYGSSVFEGIRCYETPQGPSIFRLRDHIRRLFDSAHIYRIEIPFSQDEIMEACRQVIKVNQLQSGYLRPLVFRGYNTLGVDPSKCPVDVVVAALNWGRYLGEEAISQGVDICVSSWNRLAPNTMPSMAKAGSNYMNSQLMKMEAMANGFAEAIALDVNGNVSEGSGENVFLVRDGVLYTPLMANSILPGITRQCVMTLIREMGMEVVETVIPREMLYLADEIFFTGTAAEVSPVRSVDHYTIGSGRRGPVTEKIQSRYFDHIYGKCQDRYGWHDFVR